MHAPSWDRETFAKTWEQVMEESGLSQAELAQMTGAAQASVSRWAKAQVRPGHDVLRRLVDTLTRRYPKLGDLPARLLIAAGYGDTTYVPPVDEEVEAVRQAAAEIEDAARRERVESLIERTLREMEEEQARRLAQLREIIGLAKDDTE